MVLKEILHKKMENPYFRPKVISWDFTKSFVWPAATKVNKLAVVSDGHTLTKFTVFEQFGTKIKAGNGNIMRGNEPPYFINVDGRTRLFSTSELSVTDDLHKEAEARLDPPSPHQHQAGPQESRGSAGGGKFFHGF